MKNIKKDFPILQQKINGNKLVYLDSSATSQKPQIVLDSILNYYQTYNANVRRGLYPMAEKATQKVEEVREKVAKFINAKHPEEIVFVRNSTEAINLVMHAWGKTNIKKNDVITTTIMEHHSNFVPWQQLCLEKGAGFEVVDIGKNYKLGIMNQESKIKKAKLLAIAHVSNVLGTINAIKEIIKEVRKINKNIVVLVDGAQAVPHMKVDVRDLDADFYVFSGHKMMASTGIGVLYGKKKLLEEMPPFLFGSDMIREVNIEKTTFSDVSEKFEVGTPDIAGIVSLGAAIDYLNCIGMETIRNHELGILNYALKELEKIEGVILYGPRDSKNRGGVISFNLNGIHPHDVAQVLGDMGICIRAGHHCAMPLHTRLRIQSSARVSFYIYNDESDVDCLIEGLQKVKKIFKA